MKSLNKIIAVAITAITLCGVSAKAQFYSYRSFVNGFNLQDVSFTANTTNNIIFGGTNTAQGWGYNNYVYGNPYPASANNAYIGSNTIFGTIPAFGPYTNTAAIRDAEVWPDRNSDTASALSLFVSVTGVNNTATNAYRFTFAPVASIPINIPSIGSSSYLNPPPSSGTITNYAASTQIQNQLQFTLTANGLTAVNLFTNPPAAVTGGASHLRLLSVEMLTTNIAGIYTNLVYNSTLTNGVWYASTNTITTTNFGGAFINTGIVGFPPFNSP